MDEIDEDFMKVKSQYEIVVDKIHFTNDKIQQLQNDLVQLKEQHKKLKSYVEPHITINEIDYKTPYGKRYIGKFRLYLNDEKPKLVSISIGLIKNFKGIDDPEIMTTAKDKAIDYIKRKFPEVYKR